MSNDIVRLRKRLYAGRSLSKDWNAARQAIIYALNKEFAEKNPSLAVKYLEDEEKDPNI